MARNEFRRVMAERRGFPAFSPDFAYRTIAARKLLWLMRGYPVAGWPQ